MENVNPEIFIIPPDGMGIVERLVSEGFFDSKIEGLRKKFGIPKDQVKLYNSPNLNVELRFEDRYPNSQDFFRELLLIIIDAAYDAWRDKKLKEFKAEEEARKRR